MRDDELGAAFADVWCAVPKVVFSRTPTALRATPGSPRRRWPRRPLQRSTRPKGRLDRWCRPAAAAIELGLVDELRLFRNPVVVDGGTSFLPPVTDDVRLDLVETRTFGSRVIHERYRRAGDASDWDPPGG